MQTKREKEREYAGKFLISTLSLFLSYLHAPLLLLLHFHRIRRCFSQFSRVFSILWLCMKLWKFYMIICWVKQYFCARTHVNSYVKTTRTHTQTHAHSGKQHSSTCFCCCCCLLLLLLLLLYAAFAFFLFWHQFIHPFSLHAHMHKRYGYFKLCFLLMRTRCCTFWWAKKIRRKMFVFYFE